MKEIFLIAGEPSGDALGAGLMRALKAQSKEEIKFSGIGGALMEEEGLDSLLPMDDLCVMGILEIVWQLPRLMKIMSGVVSEIEKRDLAAVITVDLPDFNFQVMKRLKKRGKTKAKLIHYVAPSVWAWRPKRAQKIAKFLDALICLFPFEPDYFNKHKLRSQFVGHPLAESDFMSADGKAFRETYDIPPDAKTLGLFFGSRIAEVKMSGEILMDVAVLLKERFPDLRVIVPTLPKLEFEIRTLISHFDCPVYVVTNEDAKWDAFAACDAAVAVSGTVALELAAVGVPHIITYKMHPLTWGIVKIAAKVKFAHLGNILLGEAAFPEFLQGKANPVEIGRTILKIFQMQDERDKFKAKTEILREKLGVGQEPSAKAACFVLSLIG